jgi:hypothetical protein
MVDEKTDNDESSHLQPRAQTDAGDSPASVSLHEHPPVSHIMPKQAVVPTEPLVLPPKPPVTTAMPAKPELRLDITAPAPPDYSKQVPNISTGVSIPQKENAQKNVADAHPTHMQDAIEAEVGLTRPVPRVSAVPDPLQTHMSEILKGIKLPEKRSYTPEGERHREPAPRVEPSPSLDAILSAHITEHTPQSTEQNPTPVVLDTHVPQQDLFHEETEVAPVHTLKHDLQSVVREQKMSVVRAVALEQQKKRVEPVVPQVQHANRLPFVLGTMFAFLTLGLLGLGGVYGIAQLQSNTNQTVPSEALVFAEQTLGFPIPDGSPQSVKATLAQARTTGGTLGSLMHIIPTVSQNSSEGVADRPATLDEFFVAIGATPPESLMRALGDNFFFGIHTVDKNAPILVLEVESYARAFEGMLLWENGLNGDLAPVFAAVPRLVLNESGIPVERPYSDVVMRNYDVRALKDDAGNIQLYYSFPTQNLLVIAESPYTFTEILSRLRAGRHL